MGQPRISQLNSWERHKQNVHNALMIGLKLLRTPYFQDKLKGRIRSSSHPERIEWHTNWVLCLCLNVATRQLGTLNGVNWESKNQPDPDDIQPTAREEKIPDFQWGYFDHQEENQERGARMYYIECKRLGEPSSPSHILNTKYVTTGICRFILEEWSYGKGENSGAMIGYVESMKFDEILGEVNKAILNTRQFPALSNSEAWKEKDINYLEHEFERSFPKSPFKLHHFWVDVRDFDLTPK